MGWCNVELSISLSNSKSWQSYPTTTSPRMSTLTVKEIPDTSKVRRHGHNGGQEGENDKLVQDIAGRQQ